MVVTTSPPAVDADMEPFERARPCALGEQFERHEAVIQLFLE